MRAINDEMQIDYAARHGYLIVSHNDRHFTFWHRTFQHQGRQHGGILICPQNREQPPRVGLARLVLRIRMLLVWIERQPDNRNQLFRWGEVQAFLQRGERLPGFTEEEVRFAIGRGEMPR
jgi:hypothetical protein